MHKPFALQGNIAAITQNGLFVTMPIEWSHNEALEITQLYVK